MQPACRRPRPRSWSHLTRPLPPNAPLGSKGDKPKVDGSGQRRPLLSHAIHRLRPSFWSRLVRCTSSGRDCKVIPVILHGVVSPDATGLRLGFRCRKYSISVSIHDKYSIGPSFRPICTTCCLRMTNMIRVCTTCIEPGNLSQILVRMKYGSYETVTSRLCTASRSCEAQGWGMRVFFKQPICGS